MLRRKHDSDFAFDNKLRADAFLKTKESQRLIRNWISVGHEMFLSAQSGLAAAYAPYRTVRSLCHDSADKYLKAYLITNGWKMVKTRNLNELAEYVVADDETCSAVLPSIKTLGRNLGDLPFEAINKTDAEEAISAAEQIEKFVLQKLADFLDEPEAVI